MKRFLFPLAALFIASAPLAAQASTAVSQNVLYEFSFGGTGDPLAGCSICTAISNPSATQVGGPDWTFTLAAPASLFVLDNFLAGDRFELFDNLSSIGTTSAPTQGSDCGSDWGCALADPTFSRGGFLLAAGAHSITGEVLDSPFGGGAATFIINPAIITSAVPLPGTLILLTSALGLLGGAGARARAKRRA